MKKAVSVFTVVLCMLLFTISAFAEQDANLMSDYRNLSWEGDKLYYNEDYGTLSFNDGIGEAHVTFSVEDSMSFWFYADMGNYQNKGTGCIDVSFLDAENNIVKSYTTEENSGNGSFNRYQLGTHEGYVVVPENAENVRITLFFRNGEKSPYFRNLSFILSDTHSVDTSIDGWTVSGKLEIVQVDVTKADHFVWIVFVVLVPIIMFITRKLMDKAKKIS